MSTVLEVQKYQKNKSKSRVWRATSDAHFKLTVQGSYIEVYSVDLGVSWRIDGWVRMERVRDVYPMSLHQAVEIAELYLLGGPGRADREVFSV